MNSIVPDWVFTFTEGERQSFIDGDIREVWAENYPEIFTSKDIELARNQAKDGYHFVEWKAAIELFEHKGFHSLLPKYEFENHQTKYELFSSTVPQEVLAVFKEKKPAELGNTQGPDLFVIDKAAGDWFFCEVKGPGDQLRYPQIVFNELIEEASGKKVRLLRLEKLICQETQGRPEAK